MVIYGHDKPANDALFDWLRAIGLQPREWSQLIQASGSASPFIGDVLWKHCGTSRPSSRSSPSTSTSQPLRPTTAARGGSRPGLTS